MKEKNYYSCMKQIRYIDCKIDFDLLYFETVYFLEFHLILRSMSRVKNHVHFRFRFNDSPQALS